MELLRNVILEPTDIYHLGRSLGLGYDLHASLQQKLKKAGH